MKQPDKNIVKTSIVMIPLLVATTSIASTLDNQTETDLNEAVAKACEPITTGSTDKNASLSVLCTKYLFGYFDAITTKNKSNLIDNVAKPASNILINDFSPFEQRALQTRASNYLERNTINQRNSSIGFNMSCKIDKTEKNSHINFIANNFGYEGEKRETFIRSIGLWLERSDFC